MSLDLRQRSQKRMRLLVAVLVGVVVLLVGVVVGVLAAGDSDSGGKKNDAEPPKSGGASRPSEAPSDLDDDGTFHDPASWVDLPEGKTKKDGLPVKFPHTDTGGVAAAVENNRANWSLDEDEIRKGVETYSAPESQKQAVAAVPYAARVARQLAGVPTKGAVPKGANLNGWPVGVQWKTLSKDRVRVYVLSRVTSKAGEGEKTETQLQATPADAIWTGGDWKMTAAQGVDQSQIPDPADIGSKKFSEEGWKALQEGDRR